MPNLDGTGRPIDLAPGYRISAPGLVGTALTHAGRAPGTRGGGPERATAGLDEALRTTGVNDVITIEMDVRAVPPPTAVTPIRTPLGEDGLVLEVPDLGHTVGQVVLAIDEEGVATWNFPVDAQGRQEFPGVRGAGGSKRFLIRRHVPSAPPASEGQKRGLVQLVGKKVLKVLVYPAADAVLGPISAHFAGRWEEKHRPYAARPFGPDDYLRTDVPAIDAAAWRRFGDGTSLLFLHGTFSTSHAGFANLPGATLEELHHNYGGRVFAFDHFTLSEDPEQNAAVFVQHIPADVQLEIDVVCHSRGGLLARALAGEFGGSPLPRVRVRRIVFVGTPNHGTALADPDHMVAMIDRYTSILNLAPPGPASAVTEVMEGIITAVKVIGHAALTGLNGISAMNPRGAFLRRLNSGAVPTTSQYYAVAANFEPRGSLRQLVKQVVADQVLDRVFKNEANDLVVPTTGVYKGSQISGFPIPETRVLQFGSERAVAHSHYFAQPETSEKLRQWLPAER